MASPVDNGLLIYVGQTPKPTPKESAKTTDDPEKKIAETAAEKPATAPKTKTAETAAEKPATTPEIKTAEKKEAAKETAPAVKTAAAKSDQPAWLNRIDFSSEEAGKSAVLVGTTRAVEYQITKITDKKLQLKLLDTSLPEYRKRALITTRFQSAVDRVTPTQPPKTKDTIVVFELREAVPYFVKQTDNVIRVNFSPSTIPPRPYEDAKLPGLEKGTGRTVNRPGKIAPGSSWQSYDCSDSRCRAKNCQARTRPCGKRDVAGGSSLRRIYKGDPNTPAKKSPLTSMIPTSRTFSES